MRPIDDKISRMPTLGTLFCIARRFSSSFFTKRMKNCAKKQLVISNWIFNLRIRITSEFHIIFSLRSRTSVQVYSFVHRNTYRWITCLTQITSYKLIGGGGKWNTKEFFADVDKLLMSAFSTFNKHFAMCGRKRWKIATLIILKSLHKKKLRNCCVYSVNKLGGQRMEEIPSKTTLCNNSLFHSSSTMLLKYPTHTPPPSL